MGGSQGDRSPLGRRLVRLEVLSAVADRRTAVSLIPTHLPRRTFRPRIDRTTSRRSTASLRSIWRCCISWSRSFGGTTSGVQKSVRTCSDLRGRRADQTSGSGTADADLPVQSGRRSAREECQGLPRQEGPSHPLSATLTLLQLLLLLWKSILATLGGQKDVARVKVLVRDVEGLPADMGPKNGSSRSTSICIRLCS